MWSGGALDSFPKELSSTWRSNPAGVDPGALLPGKTRLGHGPFRFVLEHWDGETWRARVDTRGFGGWHGFVLTPLDRGTRVTHTLELMATPWNGLLWRMVTGRIHDWAVEAVFDRFAARLGLEGGRTPFEPMAWRSSAVLTLLRAVGRFRRARRRSGARESEKHSRTVARRAVPSR
jgi:hypothetical protein